MSSRVPRLMMEAISGYGTGLLDGPPVSIQDRKAQRNRRKALVETLNIGNWLFRSIRLVEKNWRDEVLSGQALYDPSEESEILGHYREWLGPCDRILPQIRELRRAGWKLDGREEFVANVREARSIVSGDRPPFRNRETAAAWSRIVAGRLNPRPIQIDSQGRMFEANGARYVFPGLEPDVLSSTPADDAEAGLPRSLAEVLRELRA